MKVMINLYCMVSIMIFLIINPVQAGDIDKCAPDYDISQIGYIPLDQNDKRATRRISDGDIPLN